MKMQYKWELIEDGYNRRQRLVESPSGMVVGGVEGSNYDNDGWSAFSDGEKGAQRIGTFVTEGLAKCAVEKASEAK